MDRLAQLLLLRFSPLPPVTVAAEIGEIADDVAEAVRKDTVAGGRENLEALLNKEVMEIRDLLKVGEYVTNQLFAALSTVTTTSYVMLAAVGALFNPLLPVVLGYLVPLLAAALLVGARRTFYHGLRTPYPGRKPYLALIVALLLTITPVVLGPMYGLALQLAASIPLFFPARRELERMEGELGQALEIAREAANRPWSPLSAVSPGWLKETSEWGLVESIRRIVRLAGRHGAPEALEGYLRVLDEVAGFRRAFARRGDVFSAFTCIVVALGAASLTSVAYALNKMREIGAAAGQAVPLPIALGGTVPLGHLTASLSLISVVLSVGIGWVSRGEWKWFPLFLPFLLLSLMAGYFAGWKIVELMWVIK